MQRAILEPISAWASASQRLSPFPPLTGYFGLLERLTRSYPKPAWNLGVGETVAIERPFCKVVKLENGLSSPSSPRVLVFAPLSGHYATLLRDTVKTLLPDHEVYVTDWVDARLVPPSAGSFTLNDYVQYAVDFMRELGPDLHVMAVCQPSVPVLAAVSAMASLGDAHGPRTLTLMGGPIDPRVSPTQVNELATTRPLSWFRDSLVHTVPMKHPGAGRRVYPGFLQHLAFVSMNPERHAESHWKYFLDLVRGDLESAESHRAFYDEYNAVLDMDADYYLDTVRIVFQEHLLPRGLWDVCVDGKPVRVNPAAIRDTALLTIEGELDDISGVGQTEAAQKLCKNVIRRQHHVAEGAGHYGIFSGRRFRDSIYPLIRDFIRT
jgi:poly(3-hydroxybutyrate) depolymerase